MHAYGCIYNYKGILVIWPAEGVIVYFRACGGVMNGTTICVDLFELFGMRRSQNTTRKNAFNNTENVLSKHTITLSDVLRLTMLS